MAHPTNPTAVKVKRANSLGFTWVTAENFNPAVHELFDAPHPLDRDGDGKPGGSLPKAQRKPRGKAQ